MSDSQCTTYLSSSGEINAQLFENSLDCIKIIDPSGYITDVNPGAAEALELGAPGDICGLLWPALWPDEAKATVLDSIDRGFRGERVQFAAFCPTAKGTPRWWDVVVSPVRDANGVLNTLMAVSRDVTDVYVAREALRDADVRKDEFLAILAHELRNPLSAASMAATILQSQKLDHDRTVQLGQLIARQVGHMSRLVEDLIDISRVSRGLIVLNREPVDMRLVIQDALEQLEGAVAAKGHKVELAVGDTDSSVSGDRTRLLQVVANIVGNAVRYTPAGGDIRIAIAPGAATLAITVTDSGVGIPADRMADLFGLFTRGERSSDRNSSGLGLGLALVQKLVELHAGTVTAFSAGEGQGSTFTLTLPRIS